MAARNHKGRADSSSGKPAGKPSASTARSARAPSALQKQQAGATSSAPKPQAAVFAAAVPVAVPVAAARPSGAAGVLNDWADAITPRRAAIATIVTVAVALGFFMLWRFRFVLVAVVAGIFLHIAIKPAVDWMQRRKVNRQLGVTVVYAAVFLAVAGIIGSLVPMITGQIGAFAEELPGLYRGLRNFLLRSDIELLPRLARLLPPSWDMQRLGPIVQASMSDGGAQASPLLLLSRVGSVVLYLLAVFGLGYYLTLDRERLLQAGLSRLPAARRKGMRDFINEVEVRVGQFVRGQVMLSVVVGVASLLAYWLIGIPYALALGVIAAVLEAVPMIGPILTAIPAALLAATVGPQAVLLVLVALVIIQTIESNVLVPRIMDKAVGVSPLVSILSITFFSLIFGIVGALLAIPIAAVIQLVLDRTVFKQEETAIQTELSAPVNLALAADPAASGRSNLDVLRLEAGELAQDIRKQLRSRPAGEEQINAATAELEDLIEITADALLSLLTETQTLNQQAAVAQVAVAEAAQAAAESSSDTRPDTRPDSREERA